MAKQVIKILDDLSLSKIKLRDLPRKPDGLYNMYFNKYGQLVKRAGHSGYNVSLGAGKILGMHRFYNFAMEKEFLIAWGTSLYKLADDSPHGHTALTGCPTLAANADTYFFDFYNHCFILNGEDPMMKYDRSNVRIAGITPPTTVAVLNAGGSGNLSAGVYKVKYTYVDEDDKESNGSDVSNSETATANQLITCQVYESSDVKVEYINIYRTVADGAIFYYDRQVANSTGPFWLTQSDATLGQCTVLHTDHTAPPDAPHLGTKRRSRAYIAKDDIVYISNLAQPEYFPLVTGQYIWTGNRQRVTGLLEQLSGLPVYTEDSIERLLGTNRDNFEFRNSYSTEGNIAIRSLVNCDNLLVYLEFDGIHYFDGVSTGIFSEALNEYIKTNINRTYAHLSCATYYDDKYLLCYPKGDSTTPSETIYIDLKNRTYGIYSFDFSCFSKWSRGTDGLSLKGGSNTIGRVYKVFDGLDDDGSNITAYDSPEPIDLGLPERYKNWWSIFVKVKTTTGKAFKFYYKLDDATDWILVSKTLTADTTKWYRISIGGKRARALKPRSYMSDKHYFEIQGYMICFDLEAFAEEKD